jgi:hypothetical protein
VNRASVLGVVALVCFVLAVGIVIAPGLKTARGYGAFAPNETPSGATIDEEPTNLTDLPRKERRAATRLIERGQVDLVTSEFPVFGYEITVTRVDGSWRLGEPVAYDRLFQRRVIRHDGTVYTIGPSPGYSEETMTTVQVVIGGALFLLGVGTAVLRRRWSRRT